MIFKTSDNLDLYYEVKGNETSSNTIVFLNGLTQSTVAWALVTPYFKDDYKIVLLDFIFQFNSDKTPEARSFDEHSRDVFELLEYLKIEKCNLVGLSYGSLVAQHFAINYPQKLSKLALLSTFAHKTPYYEAIETAWWNSLKIGGYELMLDIMLPTVLGEDYFKNPLIPIDLMKQSRKDVALDSASIFKLMLATKERGDFRANLRAIKTDTIVIQGEKDLLLPVHLAEEVAKNISGAKLEIIKGVGHTLNIEAIAQLTNILKRFLSS